MASIKHTDFYKDVLKEFNYPFGDVFVFKNFVVSEFKKDVLVSWKDHAKQMVEDVVRFRRSDGRDIIYISNRIHAYSVVALDWLKFFKYQYGLKGYYIVSGSPISKMNILIEQIFFKDKIKHFESIYAAINWVEKVDDMTAS